MQRIVPESFKKLYDRTQSGKAGPRQAIKMQCAECCGYDRDEVAKCTDYGCPLYNYRPFAGIKRRKAATISKDIVNATFFGSNSKEDNRIGIWDAQLKN